MYKLTYSINGIAYNNMAVTLTDYDYETAKYYESLDESLALKKENKELKEAFNLVVNKLLETKPELNEWIKNNFNQYIRG